MNAQELRDFRDTFAYCVLATTGTSMKALARPVAFVIAGTSLWVASGNGARLRHLRESAWASAAIVEGGRGDHRAIVLDGHVSVIVAAPAAVSAVYARKHGSVADWASAWCELQPETLYSNRGA